MSSYRYLVPAVVAVSLVLRLMLSATGGQNYFTDEGRYDYGVQLYRALSIGDLPKISWIATIPTHAFFIWLSSLVAAGQHLLSQLTDYGDWSLPANIPKTYWLAGSLLSLFSTLNLVLTHRLARDLGATREEAFWSLMLMSASNTGFYYSRHLLPYDAALSAALAAMIFTTGPTTMIRAAVCGLLAGVTYHLYNGYWYLVPLIALGFVSTYPSTPHFFRYMAVFGGSAVAALVLPIAIGAALGGGEYWSLLRAFGTSVKLGLFSEGWSLPWEYFWHSEGVFGVAIAGLIAATFVVGSLAGAIIPRWVKGALAMLMIGYGLLVIFSNFLEIFVVYARTVKPLIPLICLLGGWAVTRFTRLVPRVRAIAMVTTLAAATFNFWPHFGRVFPREVETAVMRNFGNPKRTLAITGSLYTFWNVRVTRPDLALVNCRELFPIRSYVGFPEGKTLLRVAHPLTYLPFQYECHTPRERRILRTKDVSIRLIQLSRPDALPDNPPLSMLYRPEDRPDGHERISTDSER